MCTRNQRRFPHLPARRIRAGLLRMCTRNQRRFPLLITRPHPLRRRSHAPCLRRASSWTTGSMKQSVEGATRARPLNHLLSGSSPPNPSGVAADPLLSEARVKAGELKNSKVARFSAATNANWCVNWNIAILSARDCIQFTINRGVLSGSFTDRMGGQARGYLAVILQAAGKSCRCKLGRPLWRVWSAPF